MKLCRSVHWLGFALFAASLALPCVAHAREDRRIDRGTDPTGGLPRPGTPSDFAGDHAIRSRVQTREDRAAESLPAPGLRHRVAVTATREPQVGAGPTNERGPTRDVAGDRNVPNSEALLARGGGPMVPSVASRYARVPVQELTLTNGTPEQTTESSMALPLGCSTIVAAGTPHVTSLSVRVVDARGRVVVERVEKGREAHVRFCPRDGGAYRVRVRARGGLDGVVASQVFVD
jgi:hypothetical protein